MLGGNKCCHRSSAAPLTLAASSPATIFSSLELIFEPYEESIIAEISEMKMEHIL